jgi:hypothetical protein
MHSEIAESSPYVPSRVSFLGPGFTVESEWGSCRRRVAALLVIVVSWCLLFPAGDLTVVVLPLSLQATVVAAFGFGGCRMEDAGCRM